LPTVLLGLELLSALAMPLLSGHGDSRFGFLAGGVSVAGELESILARSSRVLSPPYSLEISLVSDSKMPRLIFCSSESILSELGKVVKKRGAESVCNYKYPFLPANSVRKRKLISQMSSNMHTSLKAVCNKG
jgi:hypothetical protein